MFPAGGHDYFTHYFYYFTTVLDRHDLSPNEVWYHYYYDKSMGLFFLSMLLTDPLAPSLATFCFAVAAGIALYVLIERLNPGTLWPWAAVILYFVFYIYTIGTDIYTGNGGWADFQKPHETSSAFIIALLWMSMRLASAPAGEGRVWWITAALCAFVVGYVEAVSAILVGLFFCTLTMGFATVRRWPQALSFFGLATAAGIGLLSVLIINYATTGVPLDNALQWFWPIVDLRRLERWGVLPEVVRVAANRLSFAHSELPLTSEPMRIFVKNVFRTELLWSSVWRYRGGFVGLGSLPRPAGSRATALSFLREAIAANAEVKRLHAGIGCSAGLAHRYALPVAYRGPLAANLLCALYLFHAAADARDLDRGLAMDDNGRHRRATHSMDTGLSPAGGRTGRNLRRSRSAVPRGPRPRADQRREVRRRLVQHL